ncbi:MAG: AlpA family phage regulatory protein [Hyphomicrobiaceae bacterium]|nr:MAG: AlpA family phage regulatory protein [Hyphomicrobiaceae bacterium]
MRLDNHPPSPPPAPPPFSDLQFLSMKEVCRLTGFSRTHIYRLERAGAFPRRRKLSLNKIGFLRSEVEAWVHSRPQPDLPTEDDA